MSLNKKRDRKKKSVKPIVNPVSKAETRTPIPPIPVVPSPVVPTELPIDKPIIPRIPETEPSKRPILRKPISMDKGSISLHRIKMIHGVISDKENPSASDEHYPIKLEGF